eukprot:7500108-Pyramimonas_sp.AAC.1
MGCNHSLVGNKSPVARQSEAVHSPARLSTDADAWSELSRADFPTQCNAAQACTTSMPSSQHDNREGRGRGAGSE